MFSYIFMKILESRPWRYDKGIHILSAGHAKKIKNESSKVIAVIGDGSMTAGLAYEGLNQAGYTHKDKNLIVILNDNEMSISKNVGALSSFLRFLCILITSIIIKKISL